MPATLAMSSAGFAKSPARPPCDSNYRHDDATAVAADGSGSEEFFIAIGNRHTEAKPMGHAGLLGSLPGK